MKIRILNIALILFFLPAAPLARASEDPARFPRLSLKLTGGFAFLPGGGGDIETLRTDTQALFNSIPGIQGMSSSFDWKRLPASAELGAELVLDLSPHIGVGLGAGSILSSRSRGEFSYAYHVAAFLQGSGYSQDDQASYIQEFKIRAVPVRASVYVSEQIGAFRVYGFGGPELGFASIDHDYSVSAALQDKGLSTYAPHTENDTDLSVAARETVKSRTLGWRAGLGVEVRIAGPVSLGLEITGRLLRFASWTGDGTFARTTRDRSWMEGLGWWRDETRTESLSPSGKWLSVSDFDPSLRYLFMLDNLLLKSKGSSYSTYFKSRDAVIDLSGIGAGLSLRYRF